MQGKNKIHFNSTLQSWGPSQDKGSPLFSYHGQRTHVQHSIFYSHGRIAMLGCHSSLISRAMGLPKPTVRTPCSSSSVLESAEWSPRVNRACGQDRGTQRTCAKRREMSLTRPGRDFIFSKLCKRPHQSFMERLAVGTTDSAHQLQRQCQANCTCHPSAPEPLVVDGDRKYRRKGTTNIQL